MAFVSAILTAAGESTRMGRPKPLLPWHGATLVEHGVRSLSEAGADEVVVVLGHEADEIAPLVDASGGRWVINPDYRRGRTTSIKAGLRAVSAEADVIVLLSVDQPRPSELIAAVLRAHLEGDAPITTPRYQGRGGHPLVFSSALKPELEAISEEGQGLREVFEAHRGEAREVQIEDPIVRLDLNTPEDYEDARRRYGA